MTIDISQLRPGDPSPLISVPEAARLLAVSAQFVYKMTERGEMPCVRLGRLVRIERSALAAWIEASSEDTAGAQQEAGTVEKKGVWV